METFEFVVTSIARVALKEHIKIQAENVEDAITRIEDNDYYERRWRRFKSGIRTDFYIPFVL